jgi:hypothetical protein
MKSAVVLHLGKAPVCGPPSAARPLQPNPTGKIAGQAVLDERNAAVASSPAEKLPWRIALPIPAFLVCACGAAKIPAPVGSTQSTRYTCRRCCALIVRKRNIESLLAFRHGRARPSEAQFVQSPGSIEDFEIAKSE